MAQGVLGPRRGTDPTLQLAHGHNRATEGDRPHKHRDHNRDLLHQARGTSGAVDGHAQGHQQGCHAAAAVEQGNCFGHGRHRHPLGRQQAEQAADPGADRYPEPGLGAEGLLDQQAQHRQAHGQGRQAIGRACRADLRESFDAECQQQHRHQIDQSW